MNIRAMLGVAIILTAGCSRSDDPAGGRLAAVTPSPGEGGAGATGAGAAGMGASVAGFAGAPLGSGGRSGHAGAESLPAGAAGQEGGGAGVAGAAASGTCASADLVGACGSQPFGPPDCCALAGTLYDLELECFRPNHVMACSSSCSSFGDAGTCYEIDRGGGRKDLFVTSGQRGAPADLEAQGVHMVGCPGGYFEFPICPLRPERCR